MSAETFDLAEALRLMHDKDVEGEVTALLTAILANASRHPAHPDLPIIPIALDLTTSGERAFGAVMQLAALLAAVIGELAEVNGTTPESYLQSWALL